jgi:hypothetical protein
VNCAGPIEQTQLQSVSSTRSCRITIIFVYSKSCCGCFGNMCTCIYCVLYCLYCVLGSFLLCIFILICFVCTGVRTTATE